MAQQALLTACSYHHPRTQRLMRAYRIGSVKLPWVNFVPPLHGGAYRKYGDDALDISLPEDDLSDQSSETAVCSSSSTSLTANSSEIESPEQLVTRKAVRDRAPLSGDSSLGHGHDDDLLTGPPWTHLSKAAYTAMLEQKEVHRATQAYPSLDLDTQQNISREYRALHERIKDDGYYSCRYSEYGKDAIRWAFLFSLFVAFFSARWYLISAVFLGMFWVRPSTNQVALVDAFQQQIMFAAHDAGHRGITGYFVTDTLIGAFIADFCCGLSIGWWKSSHNVHHLVTNMPASLTPPSALSADPSRSMTPTSRTFPSSPRRHLTSRTS
jgi:sphingolipid 8-(E)-desaturase